LVPTKEGAVDKRTSDKIHSSAVSELCGPVN